MRSCPWPLRVNISDSPGGRYWDKKAWTRGLSWYPSGPLPSSAVLAADLADTWCPLRPPPLAASHHRGLLTPLRAVATAGRKRAAPLAASNLGQ
jgi:hypothetical protein